jgi:hypothetical protein
VTGRRTWLLTVAVLGLLAVASVAVLVGVQVAAAETRNEGGWLTGWGPLVGFATAILR